MAEDDGEAADSQSTATGGLAEDPLLRLEDVTAGYTDTDVLREVTLEVGEGAFVSLMGRNGAGKTTILRTVLGNLEPRGGRIVFDGEDITNEGPVETVGRGIAFVPEDRRIFPGLTVRENLELAQLSGSTAAAQREIDEVLDTFENLAQNENSPGSALSGGEQQMLAIARALVGGARLLLLDEPTEGLAPFIVEQVEAVVEELNEEGLTILLVEQNVRTALAADYGYVLDDGRIVHRGSTDEIERNQEVIDRYLGVTL